MKTRLTILFIIIINITVYAQFPDSETDGKYYEINGAKLWTVSFGEGEPLFFIAGGPGGTHYGLRRFDSLSTTNTLVYYDAFGRGKSDTAKSVTEYTIERDIEDLEGLRKAMGFEKISILGHSYGGVVAQGYAFKYPENVSHLIVANSFHSYLMWQENCDNSNHEIKTNYPEVWEELMKVREQGAVSSDKVHYEIYGRVPYGFLYAYNPEKFKPSGRKRGYPYFSNRKLYYQMVGRDGDFELTSDIGKFDYRNDLKDLDLPILIYGGRYDRVAVPRMMVEYKMYCPQAEFVMFEESGHNPQVEEPSKLFALIREFLKK
ncbi:MAG: alpha/beta fold hydrolase [Ignavibacteriaceae bacterium]|nr:alpha/beta fold hydrolase [Ignavibacteriaceae bacterium]